MVQPLAPGSFQTKQLDFTRRDAARLFSRIQRPGTKRERSHAPHASRGEQARRTCPSNSLEAPTKLSRNATCVQETLFAMRGGMAAVLKKIGAEVAPVHLERVQCPSQLPCCRSCQARARWRRASSRLVKSLSHQRQAACLAAVLLRRSGAAHAMMLACVSLCAAVCGPYGVWPCGWVWLRELRRRRPKKAMVASGSQW